MGILDQPNTVIVPPASIAANALITEARDVYTRMLSSFTEGARYFWQNPSGLTQQEIADALGAAGVEVFALHGKLGALLAEVNPAAIAEAIAVVGEFTYGEDGRVTITSVPTPPDPEPLPEPALPE